MSGSVAGSAQQIGHALGFRLGLAIGVDRFDHRAQVRILLAQFGDHLAAGIAVGHQGFQFLVAGQHPVQALVQAHLTVLLAAAARAAIGSGTFRLK